MAITPEVRPRLDPRNPIYCRVGLGHWAIYKAPEENPEYPWFVEHRIVPSVSDPRRPHDDVEHEYGSFRTHEAALRAALEWFDRECRVYEAWHRRLNCPKVGQGKARP